MCVMVSPAVGPGWIGRLGTGEDCYVGRARRGQVHPQQKHDLEVLQVTKKMAKGGEGMKPSNQRLYHPAGDL